MREAMDIYGSDKPDTRYDMKITDLGDVFANTEFKIFRSILEGGGVVRAINAKGFAGITTGQMNRLNEIAVQAGLPGEKPRLHQTRKRRIQEPALEVLQRLRKKPTSSPSSTSRKAISCFSPPDRAIR